MALLDLLERQPSRLLHQVDEPEVPRAEYDDVLARDVVLRALPPLRLPRRLTDRMADHPPLLVPPGVLGPRAVLERALDELVEPVAVPLLERRALGLAVFGEHAEGVRAGGIAPGAADAPDLLVELD